ncbi:MAG: dockerin type I repeat-containing protein [Planctomycetota bacterium]
MTLVSATSVAPQRTVAGITTPVSRPIGSAAKSLAASIPSLGSAAVMSRTPQAPGVAQSAALKAKAQFQQLSIAAAAAPPPSAGGAGTTGLAGDVNADGVVTAADSKALLEHLFQGASPAGLANADVNGDGQVDVSDVVKLFDLLQPASGGAPTSPGGSSVVPVTPTMYSSTPATNVIASHSGRLAVSSK